MTEKDLNSKKTSQKTKKVHILSVHDMMSYDDLLRACIPPVRMDADIVYILTDKDYPSTAAINISSHIREHSKKRMKINVCVTPYIDDMKPILNEYLKIFCNHRTDTIYVNLSSGYQSWRIAGVAASVLYRGGINEIVPYYVTTFRHKDTLKQDFEIHELKHSDFNILSEVGD